jgi:photosystem II stability/assembly factor-like uncharacterized protein
MNKRFLTTFWLLLTVPNIVQAQWMSTQGFGAGASGSLDTLGNRLFANDTHGDMAWTSDDGESWSYVTNGLPYDDPPSAMTSIGNILIEATGYDFILYSTDSGVSWHPSNCDCAGVDIIFGLIAHDRYVFAGRGILRSSDSGRDWGSDTMGIPLPDWEYDFYSFAQNDSILFGGTEVEIVARTTDDGNRWDTSRLTPNPYIGDIVNALTIIGNVVLAGTKGGLLRSTDLGVTWSQIDSSKFTYHSGILSLLTVNGNVIAGIQGGIFISRDSGLTWEPFGQGLPAGSWPFYLIAHGDYLFAGLQNSGGVWRRPLSDLNGNDFVSPPPQAMESIGVLKIYDLLGRLIYRGPASSKPLLSAGFYFERTGSTVKKVWVP